MFALTFKIEIYMASFVIGFFSIILIVISLFVTLIVLMQKPSANAGMGSSLGGGIAESAFGGESGNVLTRWTIYSIVAFFIIAFGLYLFHMGRLGANVGEIGAGLPEISMTEAPLQSEEHVPGSLTEPTSQPSSENSEQ